MTLKKLIYTILLLTLAYNLSINCMEENPEYSALFDEQEIACLEKLPDELLLLIFYCSINNIINNNRPADAEKEFKFFLSSICLAKKKFYELKDDLEKYFIKSKREVNNEIKENQSDPIYFKPKSHEFIR